jgi:hypothetical protein
MHSVKNRFLMRMKNMTGDLYRRHWVAITARDIVVAGCCLLYEHYSLRAFLHVLKSWRRTWRKAPLDHGPQACQRRLHRRLVPLRARQPPRSQEGPRGPSIACSNRAKLIF